MGQKSSLAEKLHSHPVGNMMRVPGRKIVMSLNNLLATSYDKSIQLKKLVCHSQAIDHGIRSETVLAEQIVVSLTDY